MQQLYCKGSSLRFWSIRALARNDTVAFLSLLPPRYSREHLAGIRKRTDDKRTTAKSKLFQTTSQPRLHSRSSLPTILISSRLRYYSLLITLRALTCLLLHFSDESSPLGTRHTLNNCVWTIIAFSASAHSLTKWHDV